MRRISLNRMRWGGAKTWVLVVLILLAAILVPVGLYFVSTMSFSNGTSGANLSVPDTGYVPGAAQAAAPTPAATLSAPTNSTIAPGSKTLDLLVIDQETKQPIAGMRAVVNRPRFTGTTGDDGHVRVAVPAGLNPNFNIRVSGKGYIAERLIWAPYNPAYQGEIPASYTAAMERGTKVRGKIVDDSGQPVEGATVVLDFTKKAENSHEAFDVNGDNRNRPIKTAEDGTWSFSGAPANCDQIGLTAWDYDHVTGDYYRPEPYTPVSALYDGTAVYTLHKGVVLDGTVIGPDGSPVSGASVSLGQERYVSNAIPPQKTDASGRFTHHFNPGDQATLVIQAAGCAPQVKRIVIGQEEQSVTIQLGRPHAITGKVLTADGTPVRGARLEVDQWQGLRQVLNADFQTDSTGAFHWNGAPAEAVTVDVNAPGMRGVQDQTITPDQDNIIKLGKTSRIRGTITDAETGKPVENAQITLGIQWNAGQEVVWQRGWQLDNNTVRPGGRFELQDQYPYPGIAVKAEAPGYLPTASRVITGDEGDVTLDLKMKAGKDLVFTVQSADGKPVAGAIAAIAGPGEQVYIQNSRQIGNGMGGQATSGADGRVDFPPQVGNFRVVAFGDAGYAEADQSDLAKSAVVTLVPWGRIEGKMMIGSKPAANQDLNVYMVQTAPFDQQEPRITDGITGKTDSDGNFSMDRVPAGTWNVGRQIPMGQNMSSTRVLGTAEVKPNETVTMKLGGMGRPVVGKVALPAYFTTHTDWQYWFCTINSADAQGFGPPPMPLLVQLLSQERQRQWMQNWLKTDEGKAWEARRRTVLAGMQNIPVSVASDGTFHVEDVPAGRYNLSITLRRTSAQNNFGDLVGTGNLQFTVPEMPAGRSDVPLMLDPVQVAKIGHYDVGDEVADLDLITTDGKNLKLSDLRGKYILLIYGAPTDATLAAAFKDVYAEYGHDERLAMVTILPEFVQKGQTPSRLNADPWTQAACVGNIGMGNQILNTNFGLNRAWLIGPDGKVVGRDLFGDPIKAAVTNALGAPQPAATEPSTMP